MSRPGRQVGRYHVVRDPFIEMEDMGAVGNDLYIIYDL